MKKAKPKRIGDQKPIKTKRKISLTDLGIAVGSDKPQEKIRASLESQIALRQSLVMARDQFAGWQFDRLKRGSEFISQELEKVEEALSDTTDVDFDYIQKLKAYKDILMSTFKNDSKENPDNHSTPNLGVVINFSS